MSYFLLAVKTWISYVSGQQDHFSKAAPGPPMNVILTELVAMERCYREHGFHLRISIYPQHSHEVVQTTSGKPLPVNPVLISTNALKALKNCK
jgi:hypothetical protein